MQLRVFNYETFVDDFVPDIRRFRPMGLVLMPDVSPGVHDRGRPPGGVFRGGGKARAGGGNGAGATPQHLADDFGVVDGRPR